MAHGILGFCNSIKKTCDKRIYSSQIPKEQSIDLLENNQPSGL